MDYAAYRPRYPRQLFEYLGSLCSERELVWDCGTGNGQAATELAGFFQRVVATDISEPLLKLAEQHPRVQYLQASAEKSPLETASADLVTVAQAFHWFKHADFYKEVSRVLKPGSPLAIWCYELCTVAPEIDAIVMDLYKNTLGDRYWEPGKKARRKRLPRHHRSIRRADRAEFRNPHRMVSGAIRGLSGHVVRDEKIHEGQSIQSD